MPLNIYLNRNLNKKSILSALLIIVFLYFPFSASADISLLKKYISEYNLERHTLSLSEKTYRGEEGILRINPEVGRLLGLRVFIDQDYLKAMELYDKAEGLFETITDIFASREKETYSGEHVDKIARLAIHHNEIIELAWKHILNYRSKLENEVDERLDKDACLRLLEKLLKEDIQKASSNLRNALGNLYNRCQDLDNGKPLNIDNIKFVNYVFYKFTKQAPVEAMNKYDLDICNKKNARDSWSVWKHALGTSSSSFASIVENAFEKNPKAKKNVDILLFLALMRQESNFIPRNVSYVGAAGLTQIMPSTAKGLGMKNIFSPPYFKKAGSLLGRERKLKNRAKELIPKINKSNCTKLARKARDLTQEALNCKEKRKKLYVRYKRELLKYGKDERLNPHKAAEYGLKYFSNMMRIQKGDISLALASYNAGPHRVKQYKGIPPYKETIDFRNKILKYYRIYLTRAKKNSSKNQAVRSYDKRLSERAS